MATRGVTRAVLGAIFSWWVPGPGLVGRYRLLFAWIGVLAAATLLCGVRRASGPRVRDGDNRSNSNDSRYWGAVPLAAIKGSVVGIWLSQGRSGPSLGRIGGID